jgi:hypothetical protein
MWNSQRGDSQLNGEWQDRSDEVEDVADGSELARSG